MSDGAADAEALLAIATAVSSGADLREAYRRMCRGLARLTGAETVFGWVLDRRRDHVIPVAGYHVPKNHPEILATIRDSHDLSADTEARLDEALTAFCDAFLAEHTPAPAAR